VMFPLNLDKEWKFEYSRSPFQACNILISNAEEVASCVMTRVLNEETIGMALVLFGNFSKESARHSCGYIYTILLILTTNFMQMFIAFTPRSLKLLLLVPFLSCKSEILVFSVAGELHYLVKYTLFLNKTYLFDAAFSSKH